jgi:hypothetical protein
MAKLTTAKGKQPTPPRRESSSKHGSGGMTKG